MQTTDTMTFAELKRAVSATGSPFFSKESMAFFGDSAANYGVRQGTLNTTSRLDVPVWEVFRKHPVKQGLKRSAYFEVGTFRRVWPLGE